MTTTRTIGTITELKGSMSGEFSSEAKLNDWMEDQIGQKTSCSYGANCTVVGIRAVGELDDLWINWFYTR